MHGAHPTALSGLPTSFQPPRLRTAIGTRILMLVVALMPQAAGRWWRGDIREFIAMTRREAGSHNIVCRLVVMEDGLELSLYAEDGRFLDSLTLSAERMPARAEEMAKLMESFVSVVKDVPGH